MPLTGFPNQVFRGFITLGVSNSPLTYHYRKRNETLYNMSMAVVDTMLANSNFKVTEFNLLDGNDEATRDWLAANALKVRNHQSNVRSNQP